MYAVLD